MTGLGLPRQLIVVYAVLCGVLDVIALLPGNPEFSSGWRALAPLVIQALLIWRLWHGSMGAWLIGMLFALVSVAAAFLVGPPIDLALTFFALFSAMQFFVLISPPVAGFVWRAGGRLASD